MADNIPTVENNLTDLNENTVRLLVNSLNFLPDSIFLLNTDLMCIAQFGGLFTGKNFTVPKFTGMYVQDVFPPDLAKMHYEKAKSVLKGNVEDYAWAYKHDEYTYRMHTVLSPIRSGRKEITGIIGVVRDLTETLSAKKREEERKFQLDQIIEQSPMPMMLLNPDGTSYRINEAHFKLWNVPMADHASFNLLNDEQLSKPPHSKLIERAFKGERISLPPTFYDSSRLNPQGRAKWVRPELSPVLRNDGSIEGIVLSTIDITEQYNAQMALIESEERFRSVFQNSPDAMVLLDRRTILDLNQAALRAFGFTRDEIVGRDARTVYFSDESYQQFGRIVYEELKRDGSSSSIWTFMKKSGDPLMMETRAVAMPGGRILAILQDVSKREEAELKLRQSEERFRRVFENFPEMLLLMKDGVFQDINPAGCKRFNVKREDVVGGRPETYLQDEEQLKLFRTALKKALEQPEGGRFKVEFPETDEYPMLFLDISATKLPDDHVLLHVTDQTNRIKAERDLKASEEQFRALFEHMVEIVAIHELIFDDTGSPIDYRLIDVNPSFERDFGRSRESVLGKLGSVVYQGKESPFLNQYAEVVFSGKPTTFETYFGPMDKYFSVSVTRTGVNRFATITVDISDKVKSTELLREREKLLIEAQRIGKLGNWNFILKPEERMIWSRQMYDIYDLDPSTPPPAPDQIWKYIHPDDQELFRQKVMEQRKEDSVEFSFTYRLKTPAGNIKHVRHIGSPIYREDELISIFGTLQDITQEVASIQRIRENEASLMEAQRIAHLGSWSANLYGQNIEYSEEFQRIFGLDPNNAPFTKDQLIALVHPDDRARVKEFFYQQSFGVDREYATEYRLLLPNGSVKHLRHVTKIHGDPSGTAQRAFGTVQDITSQIVAEEERRRLENQILHTQKLESLGVLAGGIAHDFNNILMTILGNADLALSELSAHSPARQNLEDILSASKQAAELTKQMLAYSGKGHFQAIPLDLSRLVNEMTNILEVSVSKKTLLQREFAPKLPAVRMDAGQVRQVIMNLIINAAEAIGDSEGLIKIRTGASRLTAEQLRSPYLEEELPDGNYVYLEVQDTGSGMDEETLERLFDPFFTTKFTGRGLGLASVLGIVRGHRGTISVQSEKNKGTTFTILLPAVEERARNLPDSGPDSQSWQGKGKILLVDDEPAILKVASMMIQRMGFEVLTARDGQEAVDLLVSKDAERESIAAILLDMTMPRLDGRGVIREVKRLKIDVPIILSSGYDTSEVAEDFGDELNISFIQKPYQLDSLRTALRNVTQMQ